KDLPEILEYAKEKGLITLLNTNGTKLSNEIVSFIDRVSLSLDGPEDVNDNIRGKGSYQEVIDAINLCKETKVPASFTFVINKRNINKVKDILSIGKAYKTKVNFQPMLEKQLGMSTNAKSLPSKREVREVIQFLIEKKKKGAYVGNSLGGLKHFLTYPSGELRGCISGKVYLRLSQNGHIQPCGSCKISSGLKISEIENSKIYNLLNRPECKECWCSNLVELNRIYNLEFDSIFNLLV
ncbi:radical SAM protein, partial [Nanoarchaeota archaeon]